MKALVVTAAALLAVALLGFIRAGVEAVYDGDACVKIRIGFLKFRIYPAKEKRREKREEQEAKKEEGGAEKKKGGTLEKLKPYWNPLKKALGVLKRKLRVDLLELEFTAGSKDPSESALMFGSANAGIGLILPLLENNFNIKERRLATNIDFSLSESIIYIKAVLTIAIWELLFLVLLVVWPRRKASGDEAGGAGKNTDKDKH